MRSSSLAAILSLTIFAVGSIQAQAIPGKVYNGDLYTVFQPSELIATKGTAGDLLLHTNSNDVKVQISRVSESRPGFPGHDPDTEGQPTAKDCDILPPAYAVRKPDVVAYSCTKGPVILYFITRYNSHGSATLEATYPVSQRAHWDPIVAKVAASLTRKQ